MKNYCLIWFLLFSAITAVAEQTKRVYITLDVSGSMSGDKYSLANYTTQMIVALCDDEDEVSLFLEGSEGRLSDMKAPLSFIQKKMGQLKFNTVSNHFGTQFGDIQGFNAVYKPSKNQQDWLFIIGDGVWFTESPAFEQDKNKFKETVESGTLKISLSRALKQRPFWMAATILRKKFLDSVRLLWISARMARIASRSWQNCLLGVLS